MAAKKRKRTRRETSDRVSRIAGRTLAALGEFRASDLVLFRVGDARALAASCLAQDQTKGKRKS